MMILISYYFVGRMIHVRGYIWTTVRTNHILRGGKKQKNPNNPKAC